MKKYFCDHCDRELFNTKITIKADGGFDITDNTNDRDSKFKTWYRMDFCNKKCLDSKIFKIS